MSRLRLPLLVAGLLLVSACGTDVSGPGTPECADPGDAISTATIMQVQAVPTADWGPCINELRVGWNYEDQFAERGSAVFWLDSDRVGERFVEIELADTCDPSGSELVGEPEPGVERRAIVHEEPGDLPVAVVPVSSRHVADARAMVTSVVGRKIAGRSLFPVVVDDDEPASDRVLRSLNTYGVVIVLDDAQVSTDTVELRRTGQDPEIDITLEEALDEIADDLDDPAYRAEWFHMFTGGCIVYRFDAKGAGSELIAVEIADAIGFYPLGELREGARQAGYDI